MKYIKMYFQKIHSRKTDDYWYVYTNRPSFSAQASIGGTVASFSLSIRERGVTAQATTVGQDITMWLTSEGFSDEECLLMKETHGSIAYLALDADNNSHLISSDEFNALPADEQTSLVTSIPLHA